MSHYTVIGGLRVRNAAAARHRVRIRPTPFYGALMALSPPPCTAKGVCKNIDRCAKSLMACDGFLQYTLYSGRKEKDFQKGKPTQEIYKKAFRQFTDEEDENVTCSVGRPKKAGKKKLAEKQTCIVCGEDKPRKKSFPRGSTRCFACRPKRSEQVAAARRAYRARQMALLMGVESCVG